MAIVANVHDLSSGYSLGAADVPKQSSIVFAPTAIRTGVN
jgi:hypothetical protein